MYELFSFNLSEHLLNGNVGGAGGGHIALMLQARVARSVIANIAVTFAQANAIALSQAASHDYCAGATCGTGQLRNKTIYSIQLALLAHMFADFLRGGNNARNI